MKVRFDVEFLMTSEQKMEIPNDISEDEIADYVIENWTGNPYLNAERVPFSCEIDVDSVEVIEEV